MSFLKVSVSVLILFSVVTFTQSARILCYFANPSKSHVLLALPMCEELSKRGHDVVTVTNFKHGFSGPNYKGIVIPVEGYQNSDMFKDMISGNKSLDLGLFFKASAHFVKDNIQTFKSDVFQKILNEERFDLIFFIPVFFNHVQLGIADHFNVPYVGLSPMGGMYFTRDMIGAPSFLATVPFKVFDFPKDMNFIQRLLSFIVSGIEIGITEIMDWKQKWEYEENWPNAKRSYQEMKRNISLIMYNQHVTQLKAPQPFLPMEIEVGGSQIHTKPKPLDSGIKMWLDGAKDGAILWTFGSNVPVSAIAPDKLKAMLKVLGQLKQRIIMKWELDNNHELPENVLARKWLPQNSILAHNNTILFITHGGLGGGTEALYHRVPILGMPFFGDQPSNVKNFVKEGWARALHINDVTEETFSEAINDLLSNQTYRDKVYELSDHFRDRLAPPIDTAVYWIEYVIKHKGAPHLSYPGKNLNFFQTYCLDLIAAILAILYVTKVVIVGTLKLVFRTIFRRKSTTSETKSKKKKQ